MAGKAKQFTADASVAQDTPASSPVSVGSAGNKVSEATPPTNRAKQVQAPTLAPPVSGGVDAEAEFAKGMFDLEKELAGEPQREQKQGEKTTPQKQVAKPTAETPDPLDKEIDEHEAAMAKAKLTPAKEEQEPESKAAEDDEKEPESELEEPEVGDPAYAKWLKSLSPPAAKKIERQQKQINDLKALASDRVVIAPSLDDPLSNVTSMAELDGAKTHWETVRDGIDKVRDALKEDELTPLSIRMPNGKEHTFQSLEEMKESELFAREALNAVPDKKAVLIDRARLKPWEAGTKLAPGLTDKESWENKEALAFLKANPSFKRIPDWEIKLGHMFRSMKIERDEKEGKARHVRLELDAEGNVKAPKRVVVAKAPEPKARQAPSLTRPPVSSGSRDEGIKAAQSRVEAEPNNEDALRELVKATLA